MHSSSYRRRMVMALVTLAVLVAIAAAVILMTARPWQVPDAADPHPSGSSSSDVPSGESSTPLPAPSAASPTPLTSASGAPATPTPDPGASGSPIAPELAPAAPTQPVVGGDATTVSLALIEAVQGEAVAPGETSGPAIRVTVRIDNTSDEPLDTSYVVVNAYVGEDRTPAPGLGHPGGAPFEGTLEPGASAEGVFLFSVAPESRSDVLIGVDYRAGQPTVTFRGSLD